jgi:hypothetical protein
MVGAPSVPNFFQKEYQRAQSKFKSITTKIVHIDCNNKVLGLNLKILTGQYCLEVFLHHQGKSRPQIRQAAVIG